MKSADRSPVGQIRATILYLVQMILIIDIQDRLRVRFILPEEFVTAGDIHGKLQSQR